MNEEKETNKQFLDQEKLETEKDNYKEEIVETQQEKKEFFKETFEKRIIEEKLEEELEKLEEDSEKFEEEIKKEKEQIKGLEKEGKLSRLLSVAKEKGAPFAVEIAKKMDDPYILDALHDLLVRKGFYEESLK